MLSQFLVKDLDISLVLGVLCLLLSRQWHLYGAFWYGNL